MLQLFNPEDVKVIRHTKIRAAANPYDAEWGEYFEQRESSIMLKTLKGRKFLLNLWNKQKGRCPVCNEMITTETEWLVHETVKSGKVEKTMLHKDCHKVMHNLDLSLSRPS